MSSTAAQIRENVSDMLERADLNTEVYAEVVEASNFYSGERFWFNEQRLSLSCSSSILEYTLSVTHSILQVLDVQITRNTTSYLITPISETERLELHVGGSVGDPRHYSMYGGLFIPYPSPSSVYTATINCIQNQTLSFSDSTNLLTEYAEELIKMRAAASVCMKQTHDQERAQVFKLLEQEQLQMLHNRSSRMTPARIIPTQF